MSDYQNFNTFSKSLRILLTLHISHTIHLSPLTDPGAGIFLWINFLLYITCNNYTYAGVGTDIMHAMLTHFTQLTPHYSLHSSQKNYTLCTVHCTLHTKYNYLHTTHYILHITNVTITSNTTNYKVHNNIPHPTHYILNTTICPLQTKH